MSASEVIRLSKAASLNILPLNIPSSAEVCAISLINTTTDIVVTTPAFLEPEIKGHEFLNLPTFAFYIYHARLHKRLLFDMGCRKDWWNLPPAVINAIKSHSVPGLRITSEIHEILAAGGLDPKAIDTVVWSHFHFDHVGNIQQFPPSTDLVVGPGFKASFLPGFPTDPNSPFHETDFRGRSIHEIRFDEHSLRIGQFHAHDFFGDGSFYLLGTPGHTAEHISGLVRTTPNTFVFLGGDISHFPGTYRPSRYVSMPAMLPLETKLDTRIPQPCPCSVFTSCHPGGALNARTTPFYYPSRAPESFYQDPAEAEKSVAALAQFDADENVFVAIGHDPALQEVCEQFPHATMNDWKAKRWKTQSYWNFVNELPVDGKPGRRILVEGRLRDGKPIV